MKKSLILSKNNYDISLVLLKENKLDKIYIERNGQKEITGNIYKGKVIDILNKGEIIFIDIGLEKNAFLSFENKRNIPKFNINDILIVQVETELRDKKGPKLTLDYSVTGENLILLTNSKNISISKKIKDIEEINRLKDVFLGEEMGLILRTNSQGKPKDYLIKEYNILKKIKEQININFKNKSIGLLYDNNDILKKSINLLDDEVEELIIDDTNIFEKIRTLLIKEDKINLVKKLKKYFKDEDIFEYYNINSQIERALNKKVFLNSGAYIIIEKTEALISIDVNTGQNIGNKSSQELIFETNLEATEEIARQVKLRNLAGIIIVDFIDMKKLSDRKKILESLKKYLLEGGNEINSIEYTNLGLIQFTRKRQGKELAYYYKEKCTYCEGTGDFFSSERIVLNLLKDLSYQIEDDDINEIVIKAKKNIIKELKKYINYKKIIYMEDDTFYKVGYKMELHGR